MTRLDFGKPAARSQLHDGAQARTADSANEYCMMFLEFYKIEIEAATGMLDDEE